MCLEPLDCLTWYRFLLLSYSAIWLHWENSIVVPYIIRAFKFNFLHFVNKILTVLLGFTLRPSTLHRSTINFNSFCSLINVKGSFLSITMRNRSSVSEATVHSRGDKTLGATPFSFYSHQCTFHTSCYFAIKLPAFDS